MERVISSGLMRRVPTSICLLLSVGLVITIIFLVRAGERILQLGNVPVVHGHISAAALCVP